MALLSVIRRWALRDQLSIREIARRTGLSRNTIRKYLRSGAVEPKFKVPDRPSKLDAFAGQLVRWLETEASKPRKQKRTVKQLHADLVALGYEGSYGRVAAFARAWKADRRRAEQTGGRGTFVPLAFAPGEAFQFDWSEDWAIVGGERIKLQVAHFKLSHSRAFFIRAYLLQTHEMLFDAHYHAFRVLGGVPRRGIYDNMRTAVDRVGVGKERQVNARFAAMASHYLFDAEFCNPASGWEKGQVEKNVQDSRHRLWRVAPRFPTIDALNDWLEQRCQELWREIPHGSQAGTVADVWESETACLWHCPVPLTASSNTASVYRRPVWFTLSVTATVCRPPSPIDLSACVFTRTVLSLSPRDRSFARISGSSIDPIAGRDGQFMTGGIIWR